MLNFTKGNTEIIYCTANENATFNTACYLFIFTHKITLEEVSFVLQNQNSNSKRFDQFQIPITDFFLNSTLGFWGYNILAVECPDGGNDELVESGFMTLHPASVTLPTEYTDQSNTFKIYNGE
jgi:hypothetical protein